ncbi:hypothetical protein BKA62DRAFT_742081 [Auriculariales sp. MPI-PUGE-AT-0066]|nr:hypothetical protein BKA62DRAFT_742081 [Auriculariales sp. MPI-PUGE-AT-0066]
MADLFAPRPGCPMCSIASSARDRMQSPSGHSLFSSSSSSSNTPDILWRDDNFTAYHEKPTHLHVPSIYSLSTTDLPLLVALQRIGQRLLSQISPVPPPASPSIAAPTQGTPALAPQDMSIYKIGFISSPWKDSKIPITDHLHAHAYVDKPDLAGWWRGVAYGPLAWYAMEDLIAEIRETSSNNRVKVKLNPQETRPIDTVPLAGARAGTASGYETTISGVGQLDAEQGLRVVVPNVREMEVSTPTTATPLAGASTPRRQSTIEDLTRSPSTVPLVTRGESTTSVGSNSDQDVQEIELQRTSSPIIELQLEREAADPASPSEAPATTGGLTSTI